MAKQSGLGDALYVHGVDLSGDVGAITGLSSPQGTQDMTGLRKLAHERQGLLRSGMLGYSAFFNDDTGAAHDTLSALPTADRVLTYCRSEAIGKPAACLVAKQLNYDPTRTADGSLTIAVNAESNGYGVEWCEQLTAGMRTDTTATNGASLDTTASVAFGLQAYLHVFSFTGTSATIKIQDSADDSAWLDLADGAFTAVSSAPVAERIQTGRTATVRRYLRVITTGTFSNLVFAVAINKNPVSVAF